MAGHTNRKHGRNEAKCKRYASEQRREKNKTRRVLRSSGKAAGEKYASDRGLVGYFRSLVGKGE